MGVPGPPSTVVATASGSLVDSSPACPSRLVIYEASVQYVQDRYGTVPTGTSTCPRKRLFSKLEAVCGDTVFYGVKYLHGLSAVG